MPVAGVDISPFIAKFVCVGVALDLYLPFKGIVATAAYVTRKDLTLANGSVVVVVFLVEKPCNENANGQCDEPDVPMFIQPLG